MSHPLRLVVCCLLVLGVASGPTGTSTTTKKSAMSIQDRLNSLEPEDRNIFIKIHLAQGMNSRSANISYATSDPLFNLPTDLSISPEKYTEIQDIETPDQFSENLLDYTLEEFKLDYDDVHILVLYNEVCFPGEACTDVGDIGGTCCPF